MKEKICVETKKAPKKVYRTENETKFEMYMSMCVCVYLKWQQRNIRWRHFLIPPIEINKWH